jgi:hypothetical protein
MKALRLEERLAAGAAQSLGAVLFLWAQGVGNAAQSVWRSDCDCLRVA